MLSRLLGLFRSARRPSGFDAVFYRTHYPDLWHLEDRSKLVGHYERHGRDEGRFASLDQARRHFASVGKVIPQDFNAQVYRQLNPDLQRLYKLDWQFELHFLEHGRGEGRPYGAATSAASRIEAPWETVFNLGDFMLFTTSWRRTGDLGRLDALALFEAEGVGRLTPIARDWAFDPAFYKAAYKIALERPHDLYRHWLDHGFAEGHAPNERRAIHAYVAGRDYPACFDWRCATGQDGRISALRWLFEEASPAEADVCVAGPERADLFRAIGDFHLRRGAYGHALLAYDRVSGDAARSGTLYLRRGDAQKALGQSAAAIASYRRALDHPDHSVWAAIRASSLLMDEGRHEACFALLRAEYATWAGNPDYRATIGQCFETRFSQIVAKIRERVSESRVAAERGDGDHASRDALDQSAADRDLDALTEAIAALKVANVPAAARTGNKVVILANLDIPQCTHYRVRQKQEQLASRGIPVEVFDVEDTATFTQALPGAAVAIVFRASSCPNVIEAILYARALGIPTFYDIDDLIFTSDFPDVFESYEHQISRMEYEGLRAGVPLARHAARLCDVGLASTSALAERLRPFVRSQTAHVLENGLDSAHDTAIRIGATRPKPGRDVTIFYGSGTRAHNRDFNAIVGPVLVALMERHPELHLVVVGHLDFAPPFDTVKDRISRFPFVEDLAQYWALLSACDINIAVLARNAAADCKSANKWLEAAVLQVPTVASRTRTFEEAIDAPNDGLLAANADEWMEHLSRLITDPEARRAIGRAARARALSSYGSERMGGRLVTALSSASASTKATVRGRPPARTRARLLICNVFFAPQTYGGATRVVEGNVETLVERFSSDFEVFVLTTHDGMPPGRLGVDQALGCKVFRIATDSGEDWRAFDPSIVPIYQRVLDLVRPDLVHFHCMQRLTGSLVEETLRRRVPYVVTLHDGWWISDHQFLANEDGRLVSVDAPALSQTLPQGVARLHSIERRQRLRGLLNAAHFTLPVSDSCADLYRQAGIANMRTIANGLPKLPPPPPSTARADKLVLGHIGGRSVHKGANLVEIALRQGSFPNLELVMIDGSLEFGDELRVRWGDTDVVLRGAYPQNRVHDLFASFDVLLAPSLWPETHGLAAREASAYGKWVVASDRGAIGDDIVEGRDGFRIDVGDTLDLVHVLTAMDTEPMAYKRTLTPSRRLRSAEEQAVELASLYQSILSDAPKCETSVPHPVSTLARRRILAG